MEFTASGTPVTARIFFEKAEVTGAGGLSVSSNFNTLNLPSASVQIVPPTPTPTPTPTQIPASQCASSDCERLCAVGSSCKQNPFSTTKDCICQSDISPTPIPTLIPTPQSTILAIIINRGPIGAAPTHKRVVYNVLILDEERNEVKRVKGITDAFDGISNSFKDNLVIDDPNSAFPTGSFFIKIKLNKYLAKLIPGPTLITTATANKLPATSPIVGDISGDNRIDIVDYNALVGCFGEKAQSKSCINKSEPQPGDSGTDYNADLNDDGFVDGIDYNIFLKSLNLGVSGD